jgi:hypothetical protein
MSGEQDEPPCALLGKVLLATFAPFRGALCLVLAPLGLLASDDGQDTGGPLDLPLGYVLYPFDLVSPSAISRVEHISSSSGS